VIFTSESLEKIAAGTETETRRIWQTTHVKTGGVYRTRAYRFKPYTPGDPVIRVLSVHSEFLGEMTEEVAHREGVGSLAEFRELWVRLYGTWNDSVKVHVVRFEVVP
jgi:hypothetical protein